MARKILCAYTSMQNLFKNTEFKPRYVGITDVSNSSTVLPYMLHSRDKKQSRN